MFIDPSGFSTMSGSFGSSVEYMQWMSNHRDEFYNLTSYEESKNTQSVSQKGQRNIQAEERRKAEKRYGYSRSNIKVKIKHLSFRRSILIKQMIIH